MSLHSHSNTWRVLLLGSFGLVLLCIAVASAYSIGKQATRLQVLAAPPSQPMEYPGNSAVYPKKELPGGSPAPTPISPTETVRQTKALGPTITAKPMGNEGLAFQPEDLELFIQVWEIVSQQYDGEIPDQEELLYAAINGSLEVLEDKYTRLVPPQPASLLRQDMQGSFEGIGTFVEMNEEGQLQITRPIPGQPAAEAGLKPYDIILAVDGEPLQGLSFEQAVARLRGPEGTAITVTVSRPDMAEPFEVTIVRERIEFPTVEATMLPEGIAYLRLNVFNGTARYALKIALEEMLDDNPSAIILDLRDNPGGYLNQAISIADIFLPRGVILTERNNNGFDEVFFSRDGHLGEDLPMAVLVNGGSASASEIVAAAIQARGRGYLVGETTFGKGSVQKTFTLEDGSELRVTFSRWYTPTGEGIDGRGITPDLEVASNSLEYGGPEDEQLLKAIDLLLNDQ